MKQIFTNPLRAFMLAVSFLFVLSLSAVEVEIDGINYELVSKIKEATVKAKSSGKYTRAVVIPESVEYEGVAYAVTSIGDEAFYNCFGLTRVTIPNSVTSIGELAFSGCSLTSVTIPNSVTSIGYKAFAGCLGLTSVTIGNSVTSIGDQVFYNCSGLTSVHISDLEAWCKIKFDGGYSNPLSYAGHLYLNGEEIKDLVIPNSVMSIGEGAFSGCSGLTSVTIPNSVTSIGHDAFWNCSGLTSVHISDLEAWCKIKFGSGYSNPLSYAGHLYLNGEEIKDLVIPNSVTSIGHAAFFGCSGLTSVAIPKSVTNIGEFAFYGCSGLTSVTIPNSVTSIGQYAFAHCSGLTSVTIPNSVTSIGQSAFYACYFAAENFVNQSELTDEYHWGASLVDEEVDGLMIDDNTVVRCRPSVTIAVIPSTVTSIGDRAFYYCSGLTSVTIPNSVTSIGLYAFYGCSGLTSVTIGNSVTSIGDEAFSSCPELTDVYCHAEKVPSIGRNAFEGSYVEYATLHVPTASMEEYKTTEPWSSFGTIVSLSGDMPVEPDVPVEPEIEKCETPSVVYKDGKLTLTSGTEGAEFITKVVADDAKTFYDAEIELSASYSIEVFALKSGCENSDTVNVTLCWIDQDGADEENDIINVPSVPVLVQSNGGILTLDGVPAGTDITVYTTSGTEIAKTIATGVTTSVSAGLSNGTVVIVKIGNRSVKVRLR